MTLHASNGQDSNGQGTPNGRGKGKKVQMMSGAMDYRNESELSIEAQQQLVQQLAQALVETQASQALLISRQCSSPLPNPNGSMWPDQRGSKSPVPQAMSPVMSFNHALSPVPTFKSASTRTASPVPPANGMTLNGEWISREQFLMIYALRSKQTCSSSAMDQAAAGRSMVVAGIYNVPPKTIRDIWARKIGAEWTSAGWTDRERHLHACEGAKTPEEEEAQQSTDKKRKPDVYGRGQEKPSKNRKIESDL